MTRTPGAAPAELLQRWALRLDGSPWIGFMSTVWPVRGPAGERWALKVTDAHHAPTHEAAALAAWAAAGAPVVGVIAQEGHALLLERLDADRDLARHPDADEADRLLAACLQRLGGVVAPAGVPSQAQEVERQLGSIERNLAHAPQLLDAATVDRARATLTELLADLRALPARQLCLLHDDLHHLNVLHRAGEETGAWVVIDPLPRAGLREVEVVAPLRNRWADVAATGDPDRALRRRLAVVGEPSGLDLERAAAISQAVAVDNLLWLLPREPDSLFVPPYTVLSRW